MSAFFIPAGLRTVSARDPANAANSVSHNYALKVGYVLNRKYNEAGKYYMYTVAVPNDAKGTTSISTTIYKNCEVFSGFGNPRDFADVQLISGEAPDSNLSVLSSEEVKNFARVLLLCVNGYSQSPIIIGTLRHPSRTNRGLEVDEIYHSKVNGVSMVLKEDGSLQLVVAGPEDTDGNPTNDQSVPTTISISPEGKTVVSTGANQTITISQDGVNIQTDKKVTVDASEVNLNGASEAAVKGTSYVQAEAKFLTELAAQMQALSLAITAAAAAPTPAPLAPGAAAATAIGTAATTFQSSLQSALSDSVKVG